MKSHLTISLVTVVGVLTLARAADPAPKVTPKGQVLEFGLIELVGAQQRAANPKTLDGEQQNAEGARFTEQTNRIPATPGVQFGFRYKITGVTEQGTVEFKKVVAHPPIKNQKGEVERQYSTIETLPTKNGYVSEGSGYSLDRPEELVPGVWTFELWYHEEKVVSQTFTVYTPTKRVSDAEGAISHLRQIWRDLLSAKLEENPHFALLAHQVFEPGRVGARRIKTSEAWQRISNSLTPVEKESLILLGRLDDLKRDRLVWAVTNVGDFGNGFEAYLDAGTGELLFLWVIPEG
jgi:hypothetical protein